MAGSMLRTIKQSRTIKVLVILILVLSLFFLHRAYFLGIDAFSKMHSMRNVFTPFTTHMPLKNPFHTQTLPKSESPRSKEVEQLAMFRDLYKEETWPEISHPQNVIPDQAKKKPSNPTDDSESGNDLPLFRDIYAQQAWPEISRPASIDPAKSPNTVHFIWCGQKREFRFQHYLGILSIIRLLQPLKLVIHYTHLPVLDKEWYHLWFWELKQSYGNLELSQLKTDMDSCDSKVLTSAALDLLSESGGIYIGPNIIVTRFPQATTQATYWFAGSADATGIIFALKGFDAMKKQEYLNQILKGGSKCGSIAAYNKVGALKGVPCLEVTEEIRPKHIWKDNNPFGELARWLYYGKREILEAKPSETSTIPRISHMTWLKDDFKQNQRQFAFFHMLSVLSALHVAGLRHVYVHGDHKPSGQWWDMLQSENVSFVPIDTFRSIFQQNVRLPAHRSDIIRTHILQTYGGVYQDGDVMWVNRLPDDLLRYQTVACPDWPSHSEWPAAFNIGVLMSQPQAPWLSRFLASMRKYLDRSWGYNAIMLPYKVYETNPDTLYVDHHLQVICFRGICHPTWHDDYIRQILDPRPAKPFDWMEARSYHFTLPKPPKSLTSPEELKKGNDMYAKIGHLILTKSGRESLIENS